MPPNLTEPMSSEAQKAAEDYIRQHAHWDMEDNLRVSHIETKEILEAFDRVSPIIASPWFQPHLQFR